MFTQVDHDEYLDRFFSEHAYPGVSWLHDLGRERYGMAAQTLLTEADKAAELESKHVSGLSYLCRDFTDSGWCSSC